ncbi:MAG: RNA replicase [Novosphingobium sp.]
MSAATETPGQSGPKNSRDAKPKARVGSCRQVGAILNRKGRRRYKALVHRGSFHQNELQGFFKACDPRLKGQILKAAERYDNLTKPKGMRNGALGYTGIKVLKALFECLDYQSGRLEPSYLAICKRAHLCVSAVVDAIKRLVLHGFVDLRRRYEKTGNTNGGPSVRQITNAYRLMLPPVAAKTLRNPPPVPVSDDELWRRKAEREERERMVCQLPEWEQPIVRANVTDRSLEAVLSSLARAVWAADQANVPL